MAEYCVYLTVYSGNKLPSFYIGSTSVANHISGYCGSVSSKRFKAIWKHELRCNRHLFKSIILTYHRTSEEAREREENFHRKLNVVKNPLYINEAIAGKRFSSGSTRSKETRGKMSLSKLGWDPSEETRKRMSESGKLRPPMSDLTKLKLSIKSRNPCQETREKLSIAAKGKSRPKISEALIGHVTAQETKDKIASANSNPSVETRTNRAWAAARQKQTLIFVVMDNDGVLSSWAKLEDLYDSYGISPSSLRRSLDRSPLKHGKFKGWQLLTTSTRLHWDGYFLEVRLPSEMHGCTLRPRCRPG